MRRFAFRVGVSGSLALAVAGSLLLAGTGTSTGSAEANGAPGSFRVLFTSDWSGSSETYAADPSGARPTAQVTFGRAPTCAQVGCGYTGAVPSPNGQLILYTDFSACSDASTRSSLFVARADGTHARVVARSRSKLDCPGGLAGAWSPDSRRIAYADNGRIHIVDADGRHNRLAGHGDRAQWSPDGRSIAVSAVGAPPAYGALFVRRNGHSRAVAASAWAFAWSPNGRWIAYSFSHGPTGPSEVDIVRPDGTKRRSLATTEDLVDPQWSADSRFLAAGAEIVNVASGARRQLGGLLAWQPHGHLFASADANGTHVVNAATGTSRLLTSDTAASGIWSPDGRSFAYLWLSSYSYFGHGDLRVVTLSGSTRTLVRGGGPYGGYVGPVAWTRAPTSAHYRPAQPRAVAEIRGNDLTAPWTITRLAADGDHVAYTACGHVFVWTPSTQTAVQTEPSSSLSPRCTLGGNYLAFSLYSLAVSGDRIAYGYIDGNLGQHWGLYDGRIDDPTSFVSLAGVISVNGCAVGPGGLGDLVGSTGVLVYSAWTDDLACPARTLQQQIDRVDGVGCPCPAIASSPGPLVPFDVDQARIVAGGENATVIDDSNGKQLLTVPVSPLAAQLAGSNLVILVQGHLLVYDATTGARLHDWPLPNLPSGSECASPHYGTWECSRSALLVLEDAAHDLATYVLNGAVHVVQLQSGSDITVGKGTLARFMNQGLVYADGADLHLVPFAQLPLP